MRRRLLLILLLLVGGAIVNVAVAWGCAWNAPGTKMFWPAMFERNVYSGLGARRVLIFPNGDTGRFDDYAFYVGYFGLPTAAMTCEYQDQARSGIVRKVVSGQHGGRWYILPVDPIWPGFAINTVFYAVVLWLLFAAPFALRRRLRIRRGLCPTCGYDLRGNADATACTECGTAATSRVVIR